MNKLDLRSYMSNLIRGHIQAHRTAWIVAGVGLLALIGMLVWAALAFAGWFFGMTQGAEETARRALGQVEALAPGVRDKLAGIAPPLANGVFDRVQEINSDAGLALKRMLPAPTPQRDVSGRDLGPVPRYPSLVRTQWQVAGTGAAVDYEGPGSYAAVLDHYVSGFAAEGYAQAVLSATGSAETHEYTKGRDRLILKIGKKSDAVVIVHLETKLQ